MKKLFFAFMLAALTMSLSAAVAFAQSTAGVTGTVKDSNGAVIAGADVKLTDTKTGLELTTKTNDQGVYSFPKVLPGQGYKLTFTAAGFQTLVINDVALGVGNVETHNAEMTIGEVSGTVVVTASNEVTLNTSDASIGNVIGERRLKELPIQIRNSPAALIGLQPGVVGNNVGTATTNRVGSVTGSRADQGNITIDGIDANDQATGQFAATVGNAPIDAIQEFRAVSTNPGAADGRSSGGQVELVTKSGTNEFTATCASTTARRSLLRTASSTIAAASHGPNSPAINSAAALVVQSSKTRCSSSSTTKDAVTPRAFLTCAWFL